MSAILILLILVALFLLFSINNKTSDHQELLKDVRDQLKKLSWQLDELKLQLHKKEEAFPVFLAYYRLLYLSCTSG